MTQRFAGVPDVLAHADLDDSSAELTVDSTLYSLESVYGASFTFIDRCFVFLDRPAEGQLRVTLAAKKSATQDELRGFVGEFANELLACAWREKITAENRGAIEAVTMQALAGAMGPPSLDELEDFDFSEEPFEDPLGIAMSWEEKYGKDKAKRKQGEGPEAAAPEPAEEEA
ncbi:MAG: His-Xaa-Ser system protein HxsD [Deltaproteobacteria bacterium]|nr:His-Xaa-Ser system protein HxsD [Deltaproteobacteria bacterium]